MAQPTRSNGFQSAAIAALSLALLLGVVTCAQVTSAADYLLFGISERDPVNNSTSPAAACASEIAVTTTSMELVEDGDVTRTYSTVDPFYSDVDADGGTAYGFRSMETCVYLVNAFNGTVEIPLSTNATYAGRLDVKTSRRLGTYGVWPGDNQALPSKLVFTGDGTGGHGTGSMQCFTVTRINDGIQNPKGESPFQVTLAPITAGDNAALYTGKDPCDVRVTLEDDEGPGVRVSSISRIMEEPGGGGFTSALFKVKLRTAPLQNVTIPINDLYDATNAGRREGTATPTSLLFTPGDYNVEKNVTINSADDFEVDGTKTYTVEVQTTSSADSTYNGIKPRNVVVINNDKSVPGYTWTKFDTSSGTSTGNVSGFATDEMNNMGSTYASFSLKLRSKPSANVTLNFSSSNTNISTVQTTSLTFTPTNWNVDQTVTVIGKNDDVDGAAGNGNLDYTVSFAVVTTDTTYSGQAKPSFVIRSCDNDNTHLIQPCNLSGAPYGDSRGRLSGAEPSATSYIWLITKASPGSAVTVGLTSTDTSEGTVPASVTIDSGNYNVMSTGTNRIALSHVDDIILDNTQAWTVTTATSSGGLVYDPADVEAQTTDNEVRYVMTGAAGNTNESGETSTTVKIYLAADNATQVTMTVGCTLLGDECKSVSPTSITWNANESGVGFEKTITVTGKDDTFADGNVNYSVTFSVDGGSDAVFLGFNPPSQTVTNVDDEMPGKAVFVYSSPPSGEMVGVGGADNYCQTNKPAYAPSGTYKALIVSDGTTKRIATTDGSTNAGQTGWVLSANYYYYRCSASGAATCSDEFSRLFIANGNGLISGAMSRDFTTGGTSEFWTGMSGNMMAATQTSTPAKFLDDPDYRENCAGWTYATAPNSPNPGYFGQTWSEDGGGAGTVTSNTNISCALTKKLICVQQ